MNPSYNPDANLVNMYYKRKPRVEGRIHVFSGKSQISQLKFGSGNGSRYHSPFNYDS